MKSYVEKVTLRSKNIAKITIKLCNILEYMHNEAGILHMDLKPENIIVDDNDDIFLIDLGSAVVANSKQRVNTGSPTFASPEQYLDEYATIQSDIYGLGMVMRFLCDHCDVSKENNMLDEIVKKCIKHEPSQRFKNVKKVRTELEIALNTFSSTEETFTYIFVSGIRRGIGVTHICLCLARWIREYTSVSVYDYSQNNHLRTEALKGNLESNGSFNLNMINIIPQTNETINIMDNSRVRIVDCGLLADNNIDKLKESLLSKSENNRAINLVVMGGGHGIYDELEQLKNVHKNCALFVNLVSARAFYDYANLLYEREMYRIPCIYDWQDSSDVLEQMLYEFKSEYLSEYVGKGRITAYDRICFFTKKIFGKKKKMER